MRYAAGRTLGNCTSKRRNARTVKASVKSRAGLGSLGAGFGPALALGPLLLVARTDHPPGVDLRHRDRLVAPGRRPVGPVDRRILCLLGITAPGEPAVAFLGHSRRGR